MTNMNICVKGWNRWNPAERAWPLGEFVDFLLTKTTKTHAVSVPVLVTFVAVQFPRGSDWLVAGTFFLTSVFCTNGRHWSVWMDIYLDNWGIRLWFRGALLARASERRWVIIWWGMRRASVPSAGDPWFQWLRFRHWESAVENQNRIYLGRFQRVEFPLSLGCAPAQEEERWRTKNLALSQWAVAQVASLLYL